jgi:hypothetical protein
MEYSVPLEGGWVTETARRKLRGNRTQTIARGQSQFASTGMSALQHREAGPPATAELFSDLLSNIT